MMNHKQYCSILTNSHMHLNFTQKLIRRFLLRKLAILAPVCAFLFLVQFATAQQGDAMFGFGTILAPGASSCNSNTGCPEKGGFYPSVSADVIFHKRIGFGFETTWRGAQGEYGGPGGAPYRPIITDFNAIYQPRLSKKVGIDLMGGIGVQSTRFYGYQPTSGCVYFGACFSTNHSFLVDIGGGLRYYVWHHAFVRPEVHYYHIVNNTDTFSNNDVIRVGASIGYTIGGGSD
jgi:hypothetical protein